MQSPTSDDKEEDEQLVKSNCIRNPATSRTDSLDDLTTLPDLDALTLSDSASQCAQPKTVRTSILCISDTHCGDFKVPTEKVDVLIVSGDIIENPRDNPVEQVRLAVARLSQVDAGLKLLIPGNHDEPLDPSLLRQGEKLERVQQIQAQRRSILQLFRGHGILYLEEGRHEFTLDNGARLRTYASPRTAKRHGSYKGFSYLRSIGYCFDIHEDIDVAITHGAPLNIRDGHEGQGAREHKYRGSESLRHHVAMAKPRLHVFGHHHEGYGITLVDWKSTANISTTVASGGQEPFEVECVPEKELERDEREAGRKDLLTLETLKDVSMRKDIAQRGYFRTSHGDNDQHPVKKSQNTLFVNACYSPADKNHEKHTQMPIIVDLELPRSDAENGAGEATTAVAEGQRPRPRPIACCVRYDADKTGCPMASDNGKAEGQESEGPSWRKEDGPERRAPASGRYVPPFDNITADNPNGSRLSTRSGGSSGRSSPWRSFRRDVPATNDSTAPSDSPITQGSSVVEAVVATVAAVTMTTSVQENRIDRPRTAEPQPSASRTIPVTSYRAETWPPTTITSSRTSRYVPPPHSTPSRPPRSSRPNSGYQFHAGDKQRGHRGWNAPK